MQKINKGKILPVAFYKRENVLQIARELLGKVLVTEIDGNLTSGIIYETEAYAGINDKASHAYGEKKTNRTKIMYQEGGVAYVYLCYGIHSLFNIVTNKSGTPHAVLVRGIIPYQGIEKILARAGKNKVDFNLGNGPGKVSKILGIHYFDTGTSLIFKNVKSQRNIWIENSKLKITKNDILVTKRVGVDYAGNDADLPYRFIMKNPEKFRGFVICLFL